MTDTTMSETATTAPHDDWRTRFHATARRSRVRIAAMAAALLLVGGAGGFAVGHATAGDGTPGRPGAGQAGQAGPGGSKGGPPGRSRNGSGTSGTSGTGTS